MLRTMPGLGVLWSLHSQLLECRNNDLLMAGNRLMEMVERSTRLSGTRGLRARSLRSFA